MIKGRIDPPVFNIENPKIAIRHVYATAFSFFWKQYPEMFSQVSEFMEKNGIQLFTSYLENEPDDLRQYLKDFLPNELVRIFGVENFGWTSGLTGDDGLLTVAREDYTESINRLREAAQAAFADGRRGVDAYNQRINVFQREKILAYLARKNIFPKYGFPVDTVEMVLSDRKNTMKSGLQLQRDLSSAISEYAPGSQIVANGRLITSRYIRKRPDRSWKMSRYHICDQCGELNLSFYEEGSEGPDSAGEKCCNCGEELDCANAGVYLIPEFGFEADSNSIAKPGLKKPKRTFRSDVSYIGGLFGEDEISAPLGNSVVYVNAVKSGEMAVLNRSRFYVCPSCGYTELDEKRYTRVMTKKHSNPSGWTCGNNKLQNFSLAYLFKTDILTLRFTGMEVTSQEQALSLLYGILEGASKTLEVERNDISGCLKWFWNEESGRGNFGFVFYDKTPGGAGHVRRMRDIKVLEAVLKESLSFVSGCSCGGEEMDTSCYSCLRNYYNQKHHELLQRKHIIEFLRALL